MARTTTGDRGPAARGDVDAATALLADNLALLTGTTPLTDKLLAGRSRVHRVALCWPATTHRKVVCVQVLAAFPDGTGETGAPGWGAAEAQAIAESLDLRLHDEPTARTGGFTAWRRTTTPSYHLVLLDRSQPPTGTSRLDRQCAALEAVYLDGAAWMRFYADRRFTEGSFTRLLQRVAYEVRGDVAAPDTVPGPQQGLC